MVSWSLLLEHFLALILLWAWVALAGCALLPLLRLRLGLAAVPLLGVVYWTIALYAFPFAGGLDLAAGGAILLAGVQGVAWWRSGAPRPNWTRPSWSMLILVLGSLPYTTTLLCHYVPFGMDASMHATAATVIADARGLPDTYAPVNPDVPFLPMNLGLPALAGIAMRTGGEPAAVMLAAHHLTFTILILATYLLLRNWIRRTPAAVIAVASVWMARSTQASLEWGGYPTALSIAVGLLAARLLLQHARAANWRLSLATGATIAAIPLVHGIGGGTWLYCVGPWIALAALARSKKKGATVRGLALSAAGAIGFMLVYRAAGVIEVRASDMEWTREWQEGAVPFGDNVWLDAVGYVRKDAGGGIVLAGWAAVVVLFLRKQWHAAVLLTLAWAALIVVVANVRWWVLPASFLLYPDRAIYWAPPLSAVGLALAWRSVVAAGFQSCRISYWQDWNLAGTKTRVAMAVLSVCVLCVAGFSQNRFYQRIVRTSFVNADGWEALVWAKGNLHPDRDFVQARYNATGAFLPAVARIGCTGSHHHHFAHRQVQSAFARRTVTHVLVDQALAPQTETTDGIVVFRNQTITIMAIGSTTRADQVPRLNRK